MKIGDQLVTCQDTGGHPHKPPAVGNCTCGRRAEAGSGDDTLRPDVTAIDGCASHRAGGKPLRPVVKTALQRVWRDSTTLQFGVHHERAVVVAGIGEQVARLLAAFDGAHDRSALRARARSLGLDASIVDRLVAILTEAAVLDDAATDAQPLAVLPRIERDRLAPDLASMSLVSGQLDGGLSTVSRRQHATVGVVGGGRVGGAVATLLGAAGIGHVVVDDAATCRPADCGPAGAAIGDTGSTRAQATNAAIHRVSQITRTAALTPTQHYDVVVLASGNAPEMAALNELVRSGVPHLRVIVREATAVIGPFVLPGSTSCLRCLELHRSDRDAAWPVIAAQLASGSPRNGTEACDISLATLAASITALQVLGFVDGGDPATHNGTLEIALPDWRVRRRSWRAHPSCGCCWADEAV
jgi:bacteriocin biosynthesis cyclodehydratase domain-containing protein